MRARSIVPIVLAAVTSRLAAAEPPVPGDPPRGAPRIAASKEAGRARLVVLESGRAALVAPPEGLWSIATDW